MAAIASSNQPLSNPPGRFQRTYWQPWFRFALFSFLDQRTVATLLACCRRPNDFFIASAEIRKWALCVERIGLKLNILRAVEIQVVIEQVRAEVYRDRLIDHVDLCERLKCHELVGIAASSPLMATDRRSGLLYHAAAQGILPIVQPILASNLPANSHFVSLCAAAEGGHTTVLGALIEKGFRLDTLHLGCQVFGALKEGRMPIAERLLASHPPPTDFRDEIAGLLASSARLDLLRPIFGVGLPAKVRESCVTSAARIGRADLVKELLTEEGGNLSAEARGWAVVRALEGGHPDIAKQILLTGPIEHQQHKMALNGAVEQRRPDLVKLLLPEGLAIPEDVRDWPACEAVKQDSMECLELVLKNGPISEWYRGVAVAFVSEFNRSIEMLKLIMPAGATIGQEHRQEAREKAAKHGRADILEYLK